MSDIYLCVHGHFYQPPRQNPFTGIVDHEPAAAPYHDFNEKVWDECYRPNAEHGNFGVMSFDIGPTLEAWLQARHPSTLQIAIRSAQANHATTGCGNALAHPYHHSILPLATAREKRLQIAWGVRDFRRRFGYAPEGIWLPETAADEETLDEVIAQGLQFTILAPWQSSAASVDTSEPYLVKISPRRTLSVFFYNASLSGSVSFDGEATSDARRFSTRDLEAQVSCSKRDAGRSQIIVIATDGELYGHHKQFRDLFLQQLLSVEAAARGYTPTSLAGYVARFPPVATTTIRGDTSWSCSHGISRWDTGCTCTAGDSSWKRPLRRALTELAEQLDALFEVETAHLLNRPWEALEYYLDLRDGAVAPSAYWSAHSKRSLRTSDEIRLSGLLEMQFVRHAMFLSCAWFFDDLDRIEPRIALANAHRGISLAVRNAGADVEAGFTAALAKSVSGKTGRTASDIYEEFRVSMQRQSATG